MSCAGADAVVAVDLAKVRQTLADVSARRVPRPADHLGLSRRYVTARIPVGANPQAMALSGDASTLYVANRLDDSISVIDTATDRTVRTLVIGEPPLPDGLLRGERLFYSAARTFQKQFTCGSCHPNDSFDGLQYDLEPDGIGDNIVDNRDLRGVAGTAPFTWTGKNPDIATQCGTRTAKWITRTGWLTTAQIVDLSAYINSIPPSVNPYRLVVPGADGGLTPAAQRGKIVFDRSATNSGQPIREMNQCPFCHAEPKFSAPQRFDVGTKATHDTSAEFDSAHLINIFESAPYLHDGRAATLEEIWTKYNPEDKHGVSSDWTKQQLNDLVEYLKSLTFVEEGTWAQAPTSAP